MKVLLACAAFGMLLLAAACGSDSSSPTTTDSATASETASATASPTPAASATPSHDLPPLTPFSDELAIRLHQIRDRVSQIRALPVVAIAHEGAVSTDDLRGFNLNQFADLQPEDAKQAQDSIVALHYLGLAPEDYTLESFAGDFSSEILGEYDFYNRALILVGDPNKQLTKSDELTLAHEYTHSLQDGAFGLEALEKKWGDLQSDKDGKTAYNETVECLIEGDATFTEITYAEQVFGPNWRSVLQAEAEPDNTSSGQSQLPPFLQTAVGFDYNDCYAFVAGLYQNGGWDSVNAAYQRPPETTEQVLVTSAYELHEPASDLRPADLTQTGLSGWTKQDLGQFGMFDVFNFFDSLGVPATSAYLAALGWGSGEIVVYDDPGGTPNVVQLYVSFDSDANRNEFANHLSDVHWGLHLNNPTAGTSLEFDLGTAPVRYGRVKVLTGPAVEIQVASTDAIRQAIINAGG